MTDLPKITSFLGGEPVPAGAGSFDLIDPQTLKPIGSIVEAGQGGVDAAVKVAKAAYDAFAALEAARKTLAKLETV